MSNEAHDIVLYGVKANEEKYTMSAGNNIADVEVDFDAKVSNRVKLTSGVDVQFGYLGYSEQSIVFGGSFYS